MKTISKNKFNLFFSVKKYFLPHLYKIVIFFLLLFNCLIIIASCSSFNCWNQVYLQGGQIECSESIVLEDNFDGNSLDYTTWQTHYFSQGYRHDETHKACEEVFYFDENVSVPN